MELNSEEFKIKLKQKYKNKITPIYSINEYNWLTPLEFFCRKHGSFMNTPYNVIIYNKYGCQKCGVEHRNLSNKKNAHNKRKTFDDHILKFKKIHGDLYKYPNQSFKNSQSKIIIICKIHGKFSKHIHAHLRGEGCQLCNKKPKRIKILKTEKERIDSVIAANKLRTTSKDDILSKFNKRHGDIFKYDLDTYVNVITKMRMICQHHGEFWQRPHDHLQSAYGCAICSKSGTSKKEKDWLMSLGISPNDQQHLIDINGKHIKVDGYDSRSNIIYEFLGDYWHGNPNRKNWDAGINSNNKLSFKELFNMTELRFLELKKLGYSIIYLWEYDYDNKLKMQRLFEGKLEWQ